MSEARDDLQQRVSRINVLFQQHRTLSELLPLFDHNPRIASFNLTADMTAMADRPLRLPAEVDAEGIETPPQMMAAIKAQVEKRLAAIGDELKTLGITGG